VRLHSACAGLVCDVYDHTAVVKCDGPGAAGECVGSKEEGSDPRLGSTGPDCCSTLKGIHRLA